MQLGIQDPCYFPLELLRRGLSPDCPPSTLASVCILLSNHILIASNNASDECHVIFLASIIEAVKVAWFDNKVKTEALKDNQKIKPLGRVYVAYSQAVVPFALLFFTYSNIVF